MDELLLNHVKRLKEIDEELERLARVDERQLHVAVRLLRVDLARMIAVAQAEYDAF
jgi:hypothetical protein